MKPIKPTGNETLEVRPNTIPHFATGTDGIINFFGTGYHPHVAYDIRYLSFVLSKQADENGNFWFGVSASGIPNDAIGEIEATTNVRNQHPPKVLASCTFEVV
jgi:hypothetical protein